MMLHSDVMQEFVHFVGDEKRARASAEARLQRLEAEAAAARAWAADQVSFPLD